MQYLHSVGKEIRERFSGAVEAFSTKRVTGSSLHDTSRNKTLDNVSPYLNTYNCIFLLELKCCHLVLLDKVALFPWCPGLFSIYFYSFLQATFCPSLYWFRLEILSSLEFINYKPKYSRVLSIKTSCFCFSSCRLLRASKCLSYFEAFWGMILKVLNFSIIAVEALNFHFWTRIKAAEKKVFFFQSIVSANLIFI